MGYLMKRDAFNNVTFIRHNAKKKKTSNKQKYKRLQRMKKESRRRNRK